MPQAVEFCYLSSKVLCRAYINLGGQSVLEYFDNGWWLAFKLAGYQSLPQFISYLMEN